jgi:O-antigen/teichoic acid export membrane protein
MVDPPALDHEPRDLGVSRMFLATSTWNAAARGIFLLASFLGTVLIVRALTPDTYGLYALLAILVSYAVVICDAGLSSGMLRFGTGRSSTRQSHVPLLVLSLAIQTLIAVAIGAAAIGGRPLLEQVYHTRFEHYLEIGVAIAWLTVLRLDVQNLRISVGWGSTLFIANCAFALIWVGGLLLLTKMEAGLTEVLALQAASMAVLAGFLLPTANLPGSHTRRVTFVSFALPAGMLAYSLAFMARGLVNQVVMKQSEIFFIGRYLSVKDVAFYDVGYSFAFFALMSINQAIYPVAISTLTRVAEDGLPKLRQAVVTFYKVLFIHVVPIAAIGLLYGDRLVELLYGSRMTPAGHIAQVFFGVNVLFFLTAGATVGMYALGKPWIGFRIAIGQAMLNIVLDLILIPQFGVLGAILAVAATSLLAIPFFLRAYATELGQGLVPWSYLVRCCAAASLMLILFPLKDIAKGPVSLAGLLAAAGLIYLVGIRLFRLVGQTEVRLLRLSGLPVARYAAELLGTRSRSEK